MKIALIPARGGSKRIPQKNIRNFCGKPIIAYSIDAALQSSIFDRVIVSTDDSEIAELALHYGAECPFRRPEELATDNSGTLPVIRHAITELGINQTDSWICCIYPTAPFVTSETLLSGWRVVESQCATLAVTVATYEYPVQRALRINDQGKLEMLEPAYYRHRSQDLDEVYHDAGQFYWGRADVLMRIDALLCEHAVPIRIPKYRVQDIDTPEDWIRAELMFKALQQ
jgi:pseudaminic acid cytidylyltransferase